MCATLFSSDGHILPAGSTRRQVSLALTSPPRGSESRTSLSVTGRWRPAQWSLGRRWISQKWPPTIHALDLMNSPAPMAVVTEWPSTLSRRFFERATSVRFGMVDDWT